MALDHDYWHKRWQDGETGWHQAEVTPSLLAHWAALGLSRGARVLVPFCGKSRDLIWLADQGYEVLGVEFSRLPIEQFFAEHQLTPVLRREVNATRYRADRIEIIEADIFQVEPSIFASCQGVFDRGALIAQSIEQRSRYYQHIYSALPTGCRGLLLTLDYDQALKNGPPFAVKADELETQLASWQQERLARDDISQRFLDEGIQVQADTWLLTHLGSLS